MSRRLRILVVEDEGVLALELERLLQKEGHEVVGIAPYAGLANALARELQPDLALVDLMLENDTTGVETARTLIHEYNVPVVFVTGSPDAVPEGLAGAYAVIAKPFTPQSFLAAFRYVTALVNGVEAPNPPPPILRLPRDAA